MDNLILFPLIAACALIVVFIVRSYAIWWVTQPSATDKMAEFDAWYYDECWIAASELVGPNSPEYDATFDRLYEGVARRDEWFRFYAAA